MTRLYTPEQYADLALSKMEGEHHAKTGEFLNISRYRGVLTDLFREAITAALKQAITTTNKALDADEKPELHIRKHIPDA